MVSDRRGDVAIARNNGSAQLYVNGAAVGAAIAMTPPTPTTGFSVATGLPAGSSGLHGLVDEVRFFTFAISSFSTAQLLNSAKLVTSASDSGVGSLRTMQRAGDPGFGGG